LLNMPVATASKTQTQTQEPLKGTLKLQAATSATDEAKLVDPYNYVVSTPDFARAHKLTMTLGRGPRRDRHRLPLRRVPS
jgi:hypothetical protein